MSRPTQRSLVLIVAVATVLLVALALRLPSLQTSDISTVVDRQPPVLYFTPSAAVVKAGGTFSLTLQMRPPTDIIVNAVGVSLVYPRGLVAITGKDESVSPFTIHLSDIGIATSTDLVIQGIPTLGVTTTTALATFTFKALAPGKAMISFSPKSKVLAADGKGTNILGPTQPAVITIVK